MFGILFHHYHWLQEDAHLENNVTVTLLFFCASHIFATSQSLVSLETILWWVGMSKVQRLWALHFQFLSCYPIFLRDSKLALDYSMQKVLSWAHGTHSSWISWAKYYRVQSDWLRGHVRIWWDFVSSCFFIIVQRDLLDDLVWRNLVIHRHRQWCSDCLQSKLLSCPVRTYRKTRCVQGFWRIKYLTTFSVAWWARQG